MSTILAGMAAKKTPTTRAKTASRSARSGAKPAAKSGVKPTAKAKAPVSKPTRRTIVPAPIAPADAEREFRAIAMNLWCCLTTP